MTGYRLSSEDTAMSLSQTMPLHAALARALAEHGVETMFGLIGDANMFLVHSFVHERNGHYVGAAHEAGAMFMGYGYAARTGELGVVTVTHGPALTNTVTGLVEAVRGRTPLLLIAGDTATGSRGGLQDIEQRDVVLPTGAGFEQARTPESALDDLAVAIRRAITERRPVVFNVPSDLMWREVAYRGVPLNLPERQVAYPDPAAVRRAAALLTAAKRPVILAGRGAIDARDQVARLARRLGAPVATTLKARDLFRGEAFDLGLAGSLAEPATTEILNRADLILSIGAGLNNYTTIGGSLLHNRRVVTVDLAPATVTGDAAVVADALVAEIGEKAGYPLEHAEPAAGRPVTSPGTVDVETALRRLDTILPEPRVLVNDGGRFMMESLRHLHVGDPRRLVFPENFGSIGTGMGAAIGAAAARSPEPVVLVSGDGGFMHGGVGEFATAVREGLDLIVIVCNDGGYGAEHIQFVERGLDPGLSLFTWPDLAGVAEALGGTGVTVRGLDDLDVVAKVLDDRAGPVLIDLHLDVHHITPMPH